MQSDAEDLRRRYEDAQHQIEKLQASEARYRSLVHGASYGIYRGTVDGAILEANPAFVNMLGYDSAEAVLALRTPDLFVDPSVRDRLVAEIRRSGRLDATEVDWRRRDGVLLPVRLSGRTVPGTGDAPDRPLEFEVIVEDVSRRRRLEDQLRQTQKIEAVGQLASGIAHNFNNLLTAVLGYTELLLHRHPDDPDGEDLQEIRKAARRGAELTRQLLAFSRKQVPVVRDVDIVATLGELERTMSGLLRTDIELRSVLPAEPAVVRIDPGEFQEIVLNLVLNARDALPRGGAITIRADCLHASSGERGVELEDGPWVRLSVEDTGVGIAPEIRAHLFEPFFTTKEPGAGIGLGLASVYGIVRQCRGAIAVDSEPGRGTRFRLYFPRVEGASEPAGSPEVPPVEAADERATILLVEDEEAVRSVARAILTRHGYHVLDAPTPDEACRLFEMHRGEIDLLLTDVMMPGMNGPALAARLVAEKPRLRVLYMSGYGDSEALPGVDDFSAPVLGKPFQASGLTAAVRQLLSRQRTWP